MCMKSCKAEMIVKMADFYKGNLSDVNHFLKVYSFAETLGILEKLDKNTQDTLEIAAIVHDIACPLCREKHGCTAGHYQELESETLLRAFLAEYSLPSNILERVIYLVCHHHTYDGVDGIDWQLLLEADFLVNAGEMALDRASIGSFKEKVFKTESGKQLLDSIYLK